MKRKNIIIFALSVLLLAVSFALPGAVLAIRDSAIESGAEYISMDEVELSLVSSLTPEEKLLLTGERSVASISLDAGVHMDKAAAEKTAVHSAHDLEPSAKWVCQEVSPWLMVGGDGKSLIVWEVVLASEGGALQLRLDDETGAILGLAFSRTLPQESPAAGTPASWGDLWSVLMDRFAVILDRDQFGSVDREPEYAMDLARFLLAPMGLEPETVLYDASGLFVSVAGSDLVLRMTVANDGGTDIRLNM